MGLCIHLRKLDDFKIGPNIKITVMEDSRPNEIVLLVEAPQEFEITARGKPRRPVIANPASVPHNSLRC